MNRRRHRIRSTAALVIAAALLWATNGSFSQVGQFDKNPVNPVDEASIFTPAGYDKEGTPAVAEGPDTGKLQVTVLEHETGKPTFCRVNVVGADGNYYQPADNHLTPYSLTGAWPEGHGNRKSKAPIRYFGRFFYTPGEFTVQVPAGPVRVEVWKGFEYRPKTLSTRVAAGATRSVQLTLKRTLSMDEEGYFSGDPHIHLKRETDADDKLILDLIEAEDIRYATILCYNRDTAAYTGKMDKQESPQLRGLGLGSVRVRGDYQIISGQEYRSTHYGHLNLFLRPSMVLAGKSVDPNTWPVFGVVGQETRDSGGYAFHAHGGYAQEIYADFAQGATNGVELLQFGIYRGIGLEAWYRMLNVGYRFPAVGACDYPACRKLGDCRTYVYSQTRLTFPDWFRGAAEGRSFVTTGPMLLLEVEHGAKPGGMWHIRTGERRHVLAHVRAASEVAPITNLQIIANGRVVDEIEVPAAQGKGNWIELERAIDVSKSTWIAARAFSKSPSGSPDAEAHTNPLFIYVDGKAPYNKADLDWIVAKLDEQIAALEGRDFPEKSKSVDYFKASRRRLLEIRAAGGQPAPTR